MSLTDSIPITTYVAIWGAMLSTLLACIKLWELWNDRARIDISYSFTGDAEIGNEIHISNLSNKPIILSFWTLYYCSGFWPRKKTELLERPEPGDRGCRIEAHSTLTLEFNKYNYFRWSYEVLRERKIYIGLHIVGRRPMHLLVYPQ